MKRISAAVRPEIQVLFMSGYTGEVISRHDVVDEGVALIEKPFDAKGLLQAVGRALEGAPGQQTEPPPGRS